MVAGLAQPAPGDVDGNWVYVGTGRGNYRQTSGFQRVGAMQGDWDIQRAKLDNGQRPSWVVPAAACICCLAFLIPSVFLLWPAGSATSQDVVDPCSSLVLSQVAAAECCVQGFTQHCPTTTEAPPVHVRTEYHTRVRTVPVPRAVPVPIPGPVRYVKVPVKVPAPPPPPEQIIHVVHVPSPVVNVPALGYAHALNRYATHLPTYVQEPASMAGHQPWTASPVPAPPPTIEWQEAITQHTVNKNYYDCAAGLKNWLYGWSEAKKSWCCAHRQIGCPGTWTGPGLVKPVVTKISQHIGRASDYSEALGGATAVDDLHGLDLPAHGHYTGILHVQRQKYEVSFDCSVASGSSDWYYRWSAVKKDWCCHHHHLGCPGMPHASLRGHAIHTIGGHAAGSLYDCEAGLSNWIHGWSSSKKDWCCQHEQKGCAPYHCDGDSAAWPDDRRQWCCGNFHIGCRHTTMSPLGCDAPCSLDDETSTCKSRMDWTAEHTFAGRDNACALAYSQVQVECDVCRACTIKDVGCDVGHSEGKLPYDCDAALQNFFRAWSPEKKRWCCTNQGKGCEGDHPPSVDAGPGMVWRHVQVHGYWTWQVVAAGAVGHTAGIPYNCSAGRANWQAGWSEPKKRWCCRHTHFACTSHVEARHSYTVAHTFGGHTP